MNEDNLKSLAILKLYLQFTCMQFDAFQKSLSDDQLKELDKYYQKICSEVSKDKEQE